MTSNIGNAGTTPTKPTFSQMAEGEKVGVLSKKFPEIILIAKQIIVVKESILKRNYEQKKNADAKPHLHSSHNRPSWPALMYASNATRTSSGTSNLVVVRY